MTLNLSFSRLMHTIETRDLRNLRRIWAHKDGILHAKLELQVIANRSEENVIARVG